MISKKLLPQIASEIYHTSLELFYQWIWQKCIWDVWNFETWDFNDFFFLVFVIMGANESENVKKSLLQQIAAKGVSNLSWISPPPTVLIKLRWRFLTFRFKRSIFFLKNVKYRHSNIWGTKTSIMWERATAERTGMKAGTRFQYLCIDGVPMTL